MCKPPNANPHLDEHMRRALNKIKKPSIPVEMTAVRHIERNEAVDISGSVALPTESVFKVPIAIAVLDAADRGRLHLNTAITITIRDVAPGRSPNREEPRAERPIEPNDSRLA